MERGEKLKAEGNKHVKAGKFQDAIEKYNAAIALHPFVAAYHANLSHCHFKLKRYKDMEDAARCCIEVDDLFIKGYYRLAMALKLQKKYEEALQVLDSKVMVKLEPEQKNTAAYQELLHLRHEIQSQVEGNRCSSCRTPRANKMCKGCEEAFYCSKKCQCAHWPTHKLLCRSSGEAHINCTFCKVKMRMSDAVRCRNCNHELYCSKECENNDYATHKSNCDRYLQDIKQGINKETQLFMKWYDSVPSSVVKELATHAMTKQQFLEKTPSFVVEVEVEFNPNFMGFAPTGMPKILMLSKILPEQLRDEIKRRFQMYSSTVASYQVGHMMLLRNKCDDGSAPLAKFRHQVFEPSGFRRLSLDNAFKEFRCAYGISPKLSKAWKPICAERIRSQFNVFEDAASLDFPAFVTNAYHFYDMKPLFRSHVLVIYFDIGSELGQVKKISHYEMLRMKEVHKKMPDLEKLILELKSNSSRDGQEILVTVFLSTDMAPFNFQIATMVPYDPSKIVHKSTSKHTKEANLLFGKMRKVGFFPKLPPSPDLNSYDI